MNSVISSAEFEKLIASMIRVLEKGAATVEHNAKIIDPDTKSVRQVDILVLKSSAKFHYECRHQSSKQDVQWIEELIGRKRSLCVDEMVGVSSSGFTKLAIAKARSHSIGLLDLRDFTEAKILSLPTIYCKYLVLKEMTVHLGVQRPTDTLYAFQWFSKLGLTSHQFFEEFISGLRGRISLGSTLAFWVPYPKTPAQNFLFGQSRIIPKRFHFSGKVSYHEKVYSIKTSSSLVDVLLSKWLGSIHTFGYDSCHFIKSLDIEEFMVNFAIINLPQGAAMTEIAFYTESEGPVQIKGSIRDLRKPPSVYSVEVSLEDKRETSVHLTFHRHFNLLEDAEAINRGRLATKGSVHSSH